MISEILASCRISPYEFLVVKTSLNSKVRPSAGLRASGRGRGRGKPATYEARLRAEFNKQVKGSPPAPAADQWRSIIQERGRPSLVIKLQNQNRIRKAIAERRKREAAMEKRVAAALEEAPWNNTDEDSQEFADLPSFTASPTSEEGSDWTPSNTAPASEEEPEEEKDEDAEADRASERADAAMKVLVPPPGKPRSIMTGDDARMCLFSTHWADRPATEGVKTPPVVSLREIRKMIHLEANRGVIESPDRPRLGADAVIFLRRAARLFEAHLRSVVIRNARTKRLVDAVNPTSPEKRSENKDPGWKHLSMVSRRSAAEGAAPADPRPESSGDN